MTTLAPRLFPLYLTPFESLMCCDQRPGYPMAFFIELELEGHVDRTAFEEALDASLLRHPLLQALIQPAKRNQPCWVSGGKLRPQVCWQPEGTLLDVPNRGSFDLASELGLRIWVRQGEETARVVMEFHHACTDGIGAYRFIGDLLAHYGMRTSSGSDQPELGDVDLTRLRARLQRQHHLAIYGSRLQAITAALREGLRLLDPTLSAVQQRGIPNEPQQWQTPLPGFESVTLERQQHDQLRKAAARQGATVNDLLLAELFQTIFAWNRRHSGHPGRRIRLMMPTDLREQEDFEMPATNLTSYAFLARRHRDCQDSQQLLREIARETSQIKDQGLGRRFLEALGVACRAPGVLGMLCAINRCLSTAVLSNVGDPSKRFTARFPREQGRVVCGDLKLNSLTGVPPLRWQTRATLSVFTYLRKLTVCLRCDPYLFTRGDTQELLGLYTQRLQTWSEGNTAT